MAKNILLRNETSRVLILTGIRDTANVPVKLNGKDTPGDCAECSDDVLEHPDVAKFLSVNWLSIGNLTAAPETAPAPIAEPAVTVTMEDTVTVTVEAAAEPAADLPATEPVADASTEAPANLPTKKGRKGR